MSVKISQMPAATSVGLSDILPLVQGRSNLSVSIGLLLPFVSVKQYGAKGDGVTDDLAAFTRALASNQYVFAPPGTYKVSGTINMNQSGHTLVGAGRGLTTISCSSPTATVIALLAGVAGYRIQDLSITKSVTAQAGGHGIAFGVSTQSSVLYNLEVDNCDVGVLLQCCDEGTVENVNCRTNLSYGIFIANASTLGECQWRLLKITCALNGADGIRVQAVAGVSGLILGAWDTVETFANSGSGIALAGLVATPIFDFRLANGFLGSDAISAIFFDTHAGKHRVMNTMIERVGRDATGKNFATPATNTGTGISIGANETDILISGCLIDECSFSGITHTGGLCNVTGCTIYNCGAAGIAGQRNGVLTSGGRITVCGGALTNVSGALQLYGFNSTHDAFALTGVDLSNNATASYFLAAGLTNASIVGCYSPGADAQIPGTLRKSGGAVYVNP